MPARSHQTVTISDTDCARYATRAWPSYHGEELTIIREGSTGLITRHTVEDSHGTVIGHLNRYSSVYVDRVDWRAYPVDTTGNRVGWAAQTAEARPTRKQALVDLLQFRADNPSMCA